MDERRIRRMSIDEQADVASQMPRRGENGQHVPIYQRMLELGTASLDVPFQTPPRLSVTDVPMNAGEALTRQRALADYLANGYTYTQFCNLYGPEQSNLF